MKIAILCPVGPLDRYGYQHIYWPLVENFSAFATHVYLYSTTRNRANVDDLLAHFSNVEYISNEATWFEADSSGTEVFTLQKIRSNNDLVVRQAKRDGMDCSFTISINMYVPKRTWKSLRELCKNMLEEGRPYEWLYRRYQLGDRLFHTDSRMPNMFNLQIDNLCHLDSDWTESGDGTDRIMIESGDFRDKNHVAIVDCPLEMTVQDLEDKLNFVKCYAEVKPGVNPRFIWDEYFPYYVRKFNDKIISDEPLDATGQAIARCSRSDFVSWIILKHCKNSNIKPSVAKRLVAFLRRFR